MALINCPECKKQVSDNAASCPHCGHPIKPAPTVKVEVETNKSKSIGCGALLFLFVIFFAIYFKFSSSDKPKYSPNSTPTAPAPATSAPNKRPTTTEPTTTSTTRRLKRDGTIDRPGELDELCKDWVFYRHRIIKSAQAGDEAKAAEARKAFADVNRWLSEYDENDVSAVCKKYDTPEFINRLR